jgi:hypothetical protein
MTGVSGHRGHPEADIQRAIVEALRVALPWPAFVHASCHEVRGSSDWARRQQGINQGMGALAGFADLMVCGSGRVLFLEVKTDRGRPSPAQLQFAVMVQTQGHGYAVVRSIEDAAAALAAQGIAHRPIRVLS